MNDAIVADRVKELEGQHTAKHVAAAVAAAGVSGGGDEFEHWESANAKVNDFRNYLVICTMCYVSLGAINHITRVVALLDFLGYHAFIDTYVLALTLCFWGVTIGRIRYYFLVSNILVFTVLGARYHPEYG